MPIQVVTDAQVIQATTSPPTPGDRILPVRHRRSTAVADDGTLAELGLDARRLVLYVSRLEPENNAHVVIEA